MTLYDKHKAAFDKLAADGFPNLCEAAKWHETPKSYDDAIGFNHAVHHWINGRPASRTSDARAKVWLDAQRKPIVTLPIVAAPIAPPAQATGVVLMVVASVANAERAKKMLTILGCEVEEI
jgi:hypothetical protein